MKDCPSPTNSPASRQATHNRSPVVPSEQLFGPAREVIIVHLGTVYRLRRTRNGKLLLNK